MLQVISRPENFHYQYFLTKNLSLTKEKFHGFNLDIVFYKKKYTNILIEKFLEAWQP